MGSQHDINNFNDSISQAPGLKKVRISATVPNMSKAAIYAAQKLLD